MLRRWGQEQSKVSKAPWIAGAAIVGGLALVEAARRGVFGERVQQTLGTLAVRTKEFVASVAPGGHEAPMPAAETQPAGFAAGVEEVPPVIRPDDVGGVEGRS